ncbi:MAG: hypothetical protein KBD78_15710 [Oligoflexales bacterium]|nr:hypothetical protein [Oligoflexales bacterium]
MPLQQTTVPRSLDKKLTLFGYELAEILCIFILLAAMNLLVGQTSVLLTWIPPLALAIFFRIGRKHRPENYLLHLLRFKFSPGVFTAFLDPTNDEYPFKKESHE